MGGHRSARAGATRRPRSARRRRARTARHTLVRGRQPGRRRRGRPVSHVLRARPRSHPPRIVVQASRRQDTGVRVSRRPPTHPPHARARSGTGGRVDFARARAQRRAHRGNCAGPRLWPRARRPCQRRRAVALCARRLRPRRVGRRCRARVVEPVQRDARRHSQPFVVAPCAGHARGRSGVVGRPHRLRVPRLRRRREHLARRPRAPAVARARTLRHHARRPTARFHQRDDRCCTPVGPHRHDRRNRRRARRIPQVQL